MSEVKECQKKSAWCNGKDVKLCQMKSKHSGVAWGNRYEGVMIFMCQECRKAWNGQFKIVK